MIDYESPTDSHHYYRYNPKDSDTWKYCCSDPKIWAVWFYHTEMHPNNAKEMANSVDPDQILLQEPSDVGSHCLPSPVYLKT